MRKLNFSRDQASNQKSKQLINSVTKRNNLADRLFDKPENRSYSNKRPKVFSNSAQKNTLLPTIVKEHHKKVSQDQQPSLSERNRQKEKLRTQSALQDVIIIDKVSSMKQMAEQQSKKLPYGLINKTKNAFYKTKYAMQNKFNRTLSDSRQIVSLMDRMQGKVNQSPRRQQKQKSQILTEQKTFYSKKVFNENSGSKQFMMTKRDQRIRTQGSINEPLKSTMSEKQKKSSTQNPTEMKEIDLFIYMSSDGRVPQYQFYYMLKAQSNDYYNMDIVTYQTILNNKTAAQEYFTLSGSGITKYQMSRPVEFIPLNEWDVQRKQFNEIKELQFFKKFRKWKTLKKWINILSREKMEKLCEMLSEKMFILNPFYRNILIQHSGHCQQLQQLRFITIHSDPLTIENFRGEQEKKKNFLITNLKLKSKAMHDNSVHGLKEIVEDLKNKIAGDSTVQELPDKENKGNPANKQLDQKTQIFTDLGFPSYISYGHRSMIRLEFMRFLRFAYLLDFLAIEALGKMVVMNIEYLQSFMVMGGDENDDDEVQSFEVKLPTGLMFGKTSNPEGKNIFQEQGSNVKPLFSVEIALKGNEHSLAKKFNTLTIPQMNQQILMETQHFYRELSQQMAVQKLQLKESKQTFLKFDIEGFVFKAPEQAQKAEQSQFLYEQDTIVSYRFSQNISKKIIQVNPSKERIITSILDLFNDSLDSIQVIKKWAKNEELKDYVNALEEWDEIIGQNWQSSVQGKYLTPVNWIREAPTYQRFKYFVRSSVTNTYKAIELLLLQHNNLMNAHLRNQVSNFLSLSDPRVEDQLTVFQQAYKKVIQCEEYMNLYLLDKADMYIYSLDFSEFSSIIKEEHRSVIKKLCVIYFKIIDERSRKIKKWLQQSISQVSGLIIRIQEFVISKMNLQRITAELPKRKSQIAVINKLVQLLQGSPFSGLVNKQTKDLTTDLSNLSSQLFLGLTDSQNQLPKYIQRFRKQIKTSLEKFQKQLEEYKDRINDDRYNKNDKDFDKISKELNQMQQKFNTFEDYTKRHRRYQEVLELSEYTNFKYFKEVKQEYTTRQKIFGGIVDLKKYGQEWNEMKIMQFDVKDMNVVCDKYMKDLMFSERTMPDNKAIPAFRKILFTFKDAIPVISALRCPYLEPGDFVKIQQLLKCEGQIKLQNNEQLTLGEFLKLPFQQVQEEIIDVSVWATQYFYLKKQLEEFDNTWLATQLKLKQYKQTSDIIILYDVQELIMKLDESLATVSNLLSNRYIGPLRQKAQKLQNEIILGQEVIEKIIECQRKWVYLENIFSAPDIKKQLMTEAGYFVTADKFLKNLMKKLITKPLLNRLIKMLNVLNDLTRTLQLLEEIEKKLQDYLQVKRRLFPRFYFISNDQLVEVLANSNNINMIQKNISKLYQGVGELYIEPSTPTSIDGMMSPQKEQIKFINPVSMRSNIQNWLLNMQKEMIETIKRIIRDGYRNYMNGVQKTRTQWILNHKSQVVTTANQVIWCNITQDAIKQLPDKRDALSGWYELLVKQLSQVTQLIRTQLKPLYHKIIVALITADVHNRDIVKNLMQNEVQSLHDFNWQQQLKYYLDQNDVCSIKQVNASLDYGYEYLGATSRLIITPLTDKCWITITSAIAHHLGASPAGPAGTGKTESTKDLAKGLARVCIVFNCSDQITAQMMSKLFSGLAQQGAWACLDEFNRIDIEVLSVIAQQLFSIRVGLKRQKGEVELQGKTLPIKRNFGVFITMNPGYAGRTELPDNLKSLFRPVSMMIPDYTMIAEIMLFAEGFGNASELAKKMVQLYKLASEQLSQQKHYDFGLRAVKSLLVMAGQLKRSNPKQSQEVLLIKAMKQSNIPKFLQADIYLFQALVKDLFPSVQIEDTVNIKLLTMLKALISQWKLGGEQQLAIKIMQLHEVFGVRFGVMIVGESGVGKTTIYRLLKQAMQKLLQENPAIGRKYYKVQQKIINPKSVTMGQLYGEIDVLSQQWTDGLMSSVIRQCNNCQHKNHYWITLDGPVDALWIENLNTVLDDNMTLCLANGQRIKLRQQLRMLFEVENLQVASPATVSRCGMVYVPQNNNYLYHVESSINQLPIDDDFKHHLIKIAPKTIQNVLSHKNKWFQPIPVIKLQAAQSVISLIKYFVGKIKFTHSYDENLKKINVIYAFSLIWGLGSSIQRDHYADFQTVLRAQISQLVHLPKTQTIFDFLINYDNFTSFTSWQAKITEFEYKKEMPFHELIVPTIDTEKCKHMMQILLKINKPLLMTGESGVGKTSLIVPHLFHLKQQGVNTIFLNFSAKTKPKQTQLAIESKLNKKAKTIFGARPNQSIVIFIDDINLPEIEEYGAQPTIELLRNYLDYGGFYDRAKLFWKQIVDTTLIGCGATPSGGRNQLNKRFTRHSMTLCLPQPSESNLKKIFGSILKGFFTVNNFNENIKKLADGLISSTLEFFKTIRKELLPIPSKFHYLFNLRDISKVLQGILQCSVDTVTNAQKIIQLWAHETQRIFGDRLNNTPDREWFLKAIETISKRYTEGIDAQKFFNGGYGLNFTYILSAQTDEKSYEFVDDFKKIAEFLEGKIYEYNAQMSGKLDLVFFKEAIQHILRISRIIFQERGNAMLVGVGGSGKQSLSKISAFISQSKIFMLQMGKGYNTESFRGDLQKIAISSGADEQKLCFLFVDTQIVYEQFLESINNMLNTGQVPNLFKKKEEIDDIINKVRPSALKKKKVDSPESLWSYFISNIRANLHIILCMSPAGDALRIRARKFPSLVNCCTIDWFDSWTQEALLEVSKKLLSNMEMEQKSKQSFNHLCTHANVLVKEICEQYYQAERRKVQTTPKTFLDQLELFNITLLSKKKEIDHSRKQLSEGLEKLYATNEVVSKLKVEMTKLQPQLQQQAVKTDEFLKRLAIDKQQANIVEQQVEAQTAEANQQMIEIKAIKEDAQAELGKAIPMLLQAEDALKRINKNDITEIKGYTSPHPIVVMVMEAVCVLLNQKTDWASIKVVMMEINFLQRLKNYDKNNISDNILKKLRTYTKKAEFDPAIVGAKNAASKSLCIWCRAIDNYAKVAKQVEPKKQKLAQLQRVFDEKNKVLFMKQKELQKVKNQVAKLQKQCEETLQLKNKLQNDMELTARRLQRAEKLNILLKDEGIRWTSMIENYKTTALQVPGEAFLASLYLSYLGPFTGQYRESFRIKVIEKMNEYMIMYPSQFSMVTTLYDPVTVRDWVIEGLPNDPISVQNAIIAKKGIRYPLMIDPQIQANKFLKNNLKPFNLSVVNFEQTHYLKVLENCVKSGLPVLIEEVEENLESAIDSLLARKVQIVEGIKMISLGDKKIPFDDRFYLYMTTRLPNPKFLAEIFNKSTVINFSITENGLKDQLLSEVCKLQNPQTQQKRDEIIVKVAANKKFLKESQQKTLKLLAQTKGMILDDTQLILTLEQSKLKSKEVQKDLEHNSILQEEINRSRSHYLSVAIRGTILYFVISKLCYIQKMYDFSLNYVKKLYLQGLQKAQPSQILDLRIRRLNQSITKIMFTDISKALFEQHKKLYSFLICVAIKKESRQILPNQWQLFSKGVPLRPKNFKESVSNPAPEFFDQKAWFALHKFAELKDMTPILQDIKTNQEAYKQYLSSENIYNENFPGKEVQITNNFLILLLSKIVRPQNLVRNMSEYVKRELGKYYEESHVMTIQELLDMSVYDTPLLFILSTGVDPTNSILNYCLSKSVNLQTISLGQGQGKKASSLIERSRADGSWVLLNNCHLSKSWLGSLEKIIDGFNEQSIPNKKFRLLMSSMPVDYFPSNILQNANKFTLQPPRGIKPNISRSFKQISQDVINSCPNRRKQWLQCLYSLTFFHALVQQRRKFGPLGFNILYDFNDSDLQMSLGTLKIFLNDVRQQVNWQAIWYMIGQINYGGRVTDNWDRICLLTMLKKCITPELIASDKYYYSENQSYYCLNCVTLEDFQITIDKIIPEIDPPEVFGLHVNANLTYIIQESENYVSSIQKFQPRGGDSGAGQKENKLLQIIANLSQLPQSIIVTPLPQHLKGQSEKLLPSMTNFFLQQVQKFNNFLRIIKESLEMLQKAIQGSISMNEDLDQMVSAFERNAVPRLWEKYCYETLKPLGSWFVDFKKRMEFLHGWSTSTPNAYWISCFFFPQGLLTSFLQTYARKYKVSIDSLSFKFKVTEIEKEKIITPKDGGYIYGMFFEGARYDCGRDTLVDEEVDKLHDEIGCIHLLPTENYEISDSQYNCPLYKTGKRSGTLSTTGQSTNFILGIHLNTKTEKPDYWTLKGTALLCQLNE